MKKLFYSVLFFGVLLLSMSCNASATSTSSTEALTSEVKKEFIDWEYQIAYQRGIEVVNWAIPAVSMMSMRKANFSLGGGYNTVYWMSKPPTALQEAITANNQTPYASINLSTKSGPVVLDVPPASKRTAIFGSADRKSVV